MLSIEMEDLIGILQDREEYNLSIMQSFQRIDENSELPRTIIEKRASIAEELQSIINIIKSKYDR